MRYITKYLRGWRWGGDISNGLVYQTFFLFFFLLAIKQCLILTAPWLIFSPWLMSSEILFLSAFSPMLFSRAFPLLFFLSVQGTLSSSNPSRNHFKLRSNEMATSSIQITLIRALLIRVREIEHPLECFEKFVSIVDDILWERERERERGREINIT